ncbi:hypothetical protein [Mucilaginibacter dorajii]|jgi:hypothetical protein|uniref:Uncharacterized protein n=1 Tax=Mucilaginibacter dorajii TaxID=692994 RepID=A0ABP7NZW1_9SPHI|nr:hypothetical protein [Mucilaginibacter dorajii]MCS3735627.1 hypothetical protein [Mucilaginibacter dorajii]
MNEIISLAEMAARTFTTDVIHLLKNELGDHGTVASLGNQVLIKISQTDFESRLGNVLQQIYRVIDQHFPVRQNHLSIIIQDNEARYKNVFKIWKSA